MKHLSWAPLGALALAISAIAGGAHAADEKSVAVTAIVEHPALDAVRDGVQAALKEAGYEAGKDRKSTRLNSSHSQISYAVFCLKKKKKRTRLNTELMSDNRN